MLVVFRLSLIGEFRPGDFVIPPFAWFLDCVVFIIFNSIINLARGESSASFLCAV